MFLTIEKICSIYLFSLAHLVKINMKGLLGLQLVLVRYIIHDNKLRKLLLFNNYINFVRSIVQYLHDSFIVCTLFFKLSTTTHRVLC
jgi:hypothetical protein